MLQHPAGRFAKINFLTSTGKAHYWMMQVVNGAYAYFGDRQSGCVATPTETNPEGGDVLLVLGPTPKPSNESAYNWIHAQPRVLCLLNETILTVPVSHLDVVQFVDGKWKRVAVLEDVKSTKK